MPVKQSTEMNRNENTLYLFKKGVYIFAASHRGWSFLAICPEVHELRGSAQNLGCIQLSGLHRTCRLADFAGALAGSPPVLMRAVKTTEVTLNITILLFAHFRMGSRHHQTSVFNHPQFFFLRADVVEVVECVKQLLY